MSPMFQKKKLRYREVKELVQDHLSRITLSNRTFCVMEVLYCLRYSRR